VTHVERNILTFRRPSGNRAGAWLLRLSTATTLSDDDAARQLWHPMSWALDEFFAAIEEEFGVPVGDSESLETPGEVIDFVVDNTEPLDGMNDEEFREHVAGVVGENMARTLGITRYTENSRFSQDLHVK
jgi:hypothetical protein